MRKYTLIIALAIVVNIGLFSQENDNRLFNLSRATGQKNAVSIDFGTLIWDLSTGGFGIGASYERSIHEMFAVMGHFSYSHHEWNYLAFEFHGRWYPFRTSLGKFFGMVNLGYGLFWGDNTNDDWYVHTVKISPKVGWKLLFRNGIFIEPITGWGFPFIINKNNSDLNISGGLGIGLNTGWVFNNNGIRQYFA